VSITIIEEGHGCGVAGLEENPILGVTTKLRELPVGSNAQPVGRLLNETVTL